MKDIEEGKRIKSEQNYVDATPVYPEKPITIQGMEGYETYAIDENTIGVRHKWISVEERLPKFFETVLITDGIVVGAALYYKSNSVWVRVDNFDKVNCDITHWMPLPEPPKDEFESIIKLKRPERPPSFKEWENEILAQWGGTDRPMTFDDIKVNMAEMAEKE